MSHDPPRGAAESGRRTLMTMGSAMLVAAAAAPSARAQVPRAARLLFGEPMSTDEGGSIRLMTFNFGKEPVGGTIIVVDLLSGEPFSIIELPTLPGRKGHTVDIPLAGPTRFVTTWRLTGAAAGVIGSLELRAPSGQVMHTAKIVEEHLGM